MNILKCKLKTLYWDIQRLWPSIGHVGMSPFYSFVEKVSYREVIWEKIRSSCECRKAQQAGRWKQGDAYLKNSYKWRSALLAKKMQACTSYYLLLDVNEETVKSLRWQRWTTEGNSEEEFQWRIYRKWWWKGWSRKITFTRVFMLISINSFRLQYLYSFCLITSMPFQR